MLVNLTLFMKVIIALCTYLILVLILHLLNCVLNQVIFLSAADLSAVDKFNATPWDYGKNRQLHYCQLIIMSHQRQRLVSNPASPLPNGLGLMMNGSLPFSRGDFDGSMDFDYAVSLLIITINDKT